MSTGPVRVLVVDDEPLAREVLTGLVASREDLLLEGEAASGHTALERLTSSAGDPIDLVLLDVEMPGLDGFELLEAAAEAGVAATFVFVTAYDRYAVRAFETQAIDYLVKPVTPERFERAIERCLQRRRSLDSADVKRLLGDALVRAPERILVRRGNRIVPVEVGAIDWIEASGDYVRLHCGAEAFLVEKTLVVMQELLAAHGFRRIHRSALVNEARIAELRPLGSGRYELTLINGSQLVVSRSYSAGLKQQVL